MMITKFNGFGAWPERTLYEAPHGACNPVGDKQHGQQLGVKSVNSIHSEVITICSLKVFAYFLIRLCLLPLIQNGLKSLPP